MLLNNSPSNGINLTFMYIPAHVGIVENETVDILAKEAANSTLREEQLLNSNDLKTYFKKATIEKWKQDWNQKNRFLKNIKSSLTYKLLLPERRCAQIIINRLKLGHTKLTHVYRIERQNPPYCEVCEVEFDIWHLLEDCVLYSASRVSCNIPDDIFCAFKDSFNLHSVIYFLKDNYLFNKI